MKFLNDEGVEKVRLEKGRKLMAISDILLGGCLVRPLSQRIFYEILQIGEEEN